MKAEEQNSLYEEKKKLVLARFRTLNTESKILLGGETKLSVQDLIGHIEKGDELGRKAVEVQIKMLQVLSSFE